MPIQPGLLRHRLTLQSVTRTPDAGGGAAESWGPALGTASATVWAAIEPLDGGEQLRGMAMQEGITHRIRIRYRPGVTAKMRGVMAGRVFHFRRVINVDERGELMDILAEELR
jgi:SPP1 family predicted phage head-tail adaptor